MLFRDALKWPHKKALVDGTSPLLRSSCGAAAHSMGRHAPMAILKYGDSKGT